MDKIQNKLSKLTLNMCDKNLQLKINKLIESKLFINMIYKCFDKYIKYGSRSSKKVDILHNFIKNEIEKIISDQYSVKLEQDIKSLNSSGKKRCDIVIYQNDKECVILPVKFIMSNYNQNKNNSWENLTGELIHLKWANENIKIIPINIIFNKIPYLDNTKKIKKFENITYNDIFKIMETLKNKNITYDNINYILDVEQNCNINEQYNKCPHIIKFNINTQYRTFNKIFSEIIQ